jgi:hypothetical protein
MRNDHQTEFRMEYTENGRTIHAPLLVDNFILEDLARRGSNNVRDFLRRAINEQLVEPMLDLFLKDLVAREREEAERKALFGDGPITVASMENAIQELVKRRRE